MIYALDGVAPELPQEGSYYVAPDANLIGAVRLSQDTSVWFGATIRTDNEPVTIGPRSNVQDGAVLHTDPGFPMVIGENCTIGHLAMLHGCTIEDGCLIGMRAMVMNGAVIGKGSLIGAGALVSEGKVIPPGSLVVGVPGRIIRTLSEEDQAGLLGGAESYVIKIGRYSRTLTAL